LENIYKASDADTVKATQKYIPAEGRGVIDLDGGMRTESADRKSTSDLKATRLLLIRPRLKRALSNTRARVGFDRP